MERAQAGDPEAFRALVERYQRPLFHVLSRYAPTSDDALDLVQQTLLQAYRQLSTLENPKAFRAWLFKIGVNSALNHARATSRRPTTALDDIEEPRVQPTAEREALLGERRAALYEALQHLSPMQREVVVLRIEGGLSHKEIATATGSSPGAARVHFHAAVKRLKALLHQGDENDG